MEEASFSWLTTLPALRGWGALSVSRSGSRRLEAEERKALFERLTRERSDRSDQRERHRSEARMARASGAGQAHAVYWGGRRNVEGL